MNPEEFAKEMKLIFKKYSHDTAQAHWEADRLIIVLLKQIGYEKAAKIFEKAEKWYNY